MFKSIRWKLTATYLLLLSLTIVVLTLAFIFPMQQYYLTFFERNLTSQAQLVRQLVLNSPELNADLQQQVDKWAEDIALRITVVDAGGAVFADSDEDPAKMENHRHRPEIATALAGGTGRATRFSTTTNRRLKYVALPVTRQGEIIGVSRIAIPVSDVSAIFDQIKEILGLAILAAALVGLLVSFKLSATLTQPVEEITQVAGKIAEGRFRERFSPRTDDEIAVLGKTINSMAEILEGKVNEIERHRSRLAAVLDNMVSGVTVLNGKGEIEIINLAAQKELELEQPILGRHNLEVIRNHKLNDQIKQVLHSGQVSSFEMNLLHGRKKVFLVHLAVISAAEHTDGIIAVFHDITQLRQLEQMRKDFVANVSHELKTPLTSISGFVETMLDETEMDVKTREKFLRIMAKETSRLDTLIEDLLELSRIESGRVYNEQDTVDLGEILREVTEEMRPRAEEKGLSLNLSLTEGLDVQGSVSGLAQVAINLLDNAIKYTPAGGSIDVHGHTTFGDVIIDFRDTGVGIPLEEVERIFERFYRVDKARSRKLGGTGLGLAIVKHIMENHQARIKVDSTPGVGTVFSLKFNKA